MGIALPDPLPATTPARPDAVTTSRYQGDAPFSTRAHGRHGQLSNRRVRNAGNRRPFLTHGRQGRRPALAQCLRNAPDTTKARSQGQDHHRQPVESRAHPGSPAARSSSGAVRRLVRAHGRREASQGSLGCHQQSPPAQPGETGRAPDNTRIPARCETTVKRSVKPRSPRKTDDLPAPEVLPAMGLLTEGEANGGVNAHGGAFRLHG